MKKKKKNRVLYFIFALIIAILLWMIALNEENPVATRNMVSIPVNIQGQEILASNGLVALKKQNTVTLRLKGPVLTVGTILSKDLSVYTDVSSVTKKGEYVLPVKVSGLPYGIEIAEIGPASISVDVDALTEIQMPVSINTTGTLASNLSVFSMTPSVRTVKITGPASIVSNIEKVAATIDLNDITQEITQSRPLEAYNKEGAKVGDITLSEATSEVEVLLGQKGTAEVVLIVHGKPAAGYGITSMEVNPSRVDIITRNTQSANISAVVALSGNETTDSTLTATYSVDTNTITVVNNPVIRATLKIAPLQ